MATRLTYAGIISGLLTAIALVFPLYIVLPSYYTERWPQASPTIGFIGFAFAGVILVLAGYGGTRWSWARSTAESLRAGAVIGGIAGSVAWLGIGAATAGVIGQEPIWHHGPHQTIDDSHLRWLIAETVVQVAWLVPSAFWVFLLSGGVLGSVGGVIYGLRGDSGWDRMPRPLNRTIWQALSLTCLILSCFVLLATTGVFTLLAIRAEQVQQSVGQLSFPPAGVILLPVLTVYFSALAAMWWVWQQIRLRRSHPISELRTNIRGIGIVALLVSFGTTLLWVLILPDAVFLGLGFLFMSGIGAYRAWRAVPEGKITAEPLSLSWHEWLHYVIMAWLITAVLFTIGGISVALSLSLGAIEFIGVLSTGTDTVIPTVEGSIRQIVSVHASSILGYLPISLAFIASFAIYRWSSNRATHGIRIEEKTKQLASLSDMSAISIAHQSLSGVEGLEGSTSTILRTLRRVSQDVEVALEQESAYNQRLALSVIEDRLDQLVRELASDSEYYAAIYRPVATKWREVVSTYIASLIEATEVRQEIDSPYIIGIPLTAQQELFVGRTDVTAHIEQLLTDQRRPPVFLHGQRRIGKTSLLNNLSRMLPKTIVPIFIDLQGAPSQANDHAGLLYNLARRIVNAAREERAITLPSLTREDLVIDPFTSFDEWLDTIEKLLGSHTALLALDEFEALDQAFLSGRFDRDRVLSMLRNLIQHRPHFKVLFAGSHNLEEFPYWSNYLINVQVVTLSYLKEADAYQLIEHPIKDFALRYTPEASQHVFNLTRGHPFLLQLLCAEIVALKNEQPPAERRLATKEDIEAAVPEALQSGSLFFTDLEQNQVSEQGRSLLHYLAEQGAGSVPYIHLEQYYSTAIRSVLVELTRRNLIEQTQDGYRFQVELVRRWFAQTAHSQ